MAGIAMAQDAVAQESETAKTVADTLADTMRTAVDEPSLQVPPPSGGVSPRGALLRSTLVPGWGQFATGHPFKGALFAAGATGLVVRAVTSANAANEATRNANEAETDEEYAHYVAERNARLEDRDTAITWLLILWAYNMVDAYVEGHFVGYENRTLILGGDPERPGGVEVAAIGAGPIIPARSPGTLVFPIAALRFRW